LLTLVDLKESESIARLHDELTLCDQILTEIETMMEGFELNLGNITSNIKILQDRSFHLHFQLENRIESELKLNESIHHLFISKELIQ
jgi:vacuolar protein sorting-associated protein 52